MDKRRNSRLTAVRKIIKREGARRGPSVGGVDPEVRTDGTLPVDPDGSSRGVHALGNYVVEWGYDVPESKWSDFHQWLAANEKALAQNVPSGVVYKGTVVAVFGPVNRPDGRYRTFWTLDRTARIEEFATKGKGNFKELLAQLVAFRKRGDCCENGFSQLYQVAAAVPTYSGK